MGKMTDKLGRTMAQIDGFETELEFALRDMGLPGVSEISKAGVDLDTMPEIMRLCHLVPRNARHNALRMALAAGADPNAACPWGALPIDTLYTDGDGVGLGLLIAHGAFCVDYGWTPAHLAVVRGDEAALQSLDLTQTDRLGDTPFMLACRLGRAQIAKALVPDDGPGEAILVAAQAGDLAVMKGLVAAGADINWTHEDGETALLCAVEHDHADMVGYLLENGARLDAAVNIAAPYSKSSKQPAQIQNAMDMLMARMVDYIPTYTQPIYKTIYSAACGAQVTRLLVAYGADPAEFDDAVFVAAVGLDLHPSPQIERDEFAAQYRVRFGRANPEQVQTAFWLSQMRSGVSAQSAKTKHLGPNTSTDSPVWTFDRFGRSVTRLKDGGSVIIGGAHRDQSDPDFCIYNDVTIVSPTGAIKHFIYPARVFPPTELHTATLVDDGIWIIGNLGYQRDRTIGDTPVFWLSLADFSIHPIATTGRQPGWISKHKAVLLDGAIHISEGHIAPGQADMTESYVLDLQTLVWHAVN